MRKQLFAVIFAAVFAVGCSSNDNTTSSSGSNGSTGESGSSASSSTGGSSGSTSTSGSGGSNSTSGSGSGSGSGSTSGSGGSSGGPDWTCLGSETAPTPTGSSTAVTLHFTDAVNSSSNVTGLTVKLCKLSDTTCSAPDDTATDNNGTVSLNAPLTSAAYSGFFDVTGTSVPETLIYLPPFVSDPNANIKIVTNQDLTLVGIAFGSPDLTTHGLITGSVEDCTGTAASGVSVDVSQKDSNASSTTTVYYLSGAAPANGATATTTDGTFAIKNVPVTDNEIITTTNSNGDVTGNYPVVIKAGAVTTVVAAPNN